MGFCIHAVNNPYTYIMKQLYWTSTGVINCMQSPISFPSSLPQFFLSHLTCWSSLHHFCFFPTIQLHSYFQLKMNSITNDQIMVMKSGQPLCVVLMQISCNDVLVYFSQCLVNLNFRVKGTRSVQQSSPVNTNTRGRSPSRLSQFSLFYTGCSIVHPTFL